MKNLVYCIIIFIGIVLAAYVGGWSMFIKPIIGCCQAFDAGILTGTMVGWCVLKCVFAGVAASFIIYLGYIVGALFYVL